MTTVGSPVEYSAPETAYAGFRVRFRALVIDTIVIIVSVMLIAALAIAAPSSEVTGRVLLLAFAAVLILYEPVMVSRYGATVGHRRANLMIVADRTGTNPSFPRAFLRYLIKGVLGLASFVTMALTERHQAVHDRLSGTTVQIRDLSKALPGDAKTLREPLPAAGLPSRARRATIIVAYVFLSFVAVSIIGSLILSDACLQHHYACSAGETLSNHVLSIVWIAVMAWIVVRGWQGRLYGARRRAAPSVDDIPDQAAPDGTLNQGETMARITGIGGVFFKSRGNGAELAAWYKKHLGLILEDFGGAILRWSGDTADDGGLTVWAVANSDSKWFAPSESPFMINYRVDDLDELLTQLRADGIDVIQGPESAENGTFAWIMDPDGNKLELWEPKAWNDANKSA